MHQPPNLISNFTQRGKSKNTKNGKPPTTTHPCDFPSTVAGPHTDILAGTGVTGARASLKLPIREPTSDPNHPKPSVSGEGNSGSFEKGLGNLWPKPLTVDYSHWQHASQLGTLMINNLILQAFQLIPFFPDPVVTP